MNYKKIAQLANVGIGTVSRYFNNGSISEKNIAKISKIVEQYHFKPHFRILAQKGIDNFIYVVVTSLGENFINNIVDGLKSQLNSNQQIIIIKSSLDSKEYLKNLQNIMKQKPTKMLLFLPKLNEKVQNYIKGIKNVLVVVYGQKISDIFSIYVDEVSAMEKLVIQYIKKVKPKKLAYIGKDVSDITTGKQRYDAFKKVAKQANIKSKAFLVDNNHPQIIKEAFQSATNQNYQDIICGTHTIFTTCSLLNKNASLKLTDIGYFNFLDQEKTYVLKVFIDFFLIGITIGDIFNEKITTKVIKIKATIIE